MKLNIVKPNLETYGQLNDKLFSIGDHSFIFDILRSKLYSNPIAAVCREYSCNARDSHREAGKPNEAIEISLPTRLDPTFKVKDFGVGISPDRIENVFIRYGISTKREDNIQVGSFGIGCKCAFSIVDSFLVITTFNGIKYSYSCVIDDSKAGKIVLLDEIVTDLQNGTEIIIPVKPADFPTFSREIEIATRHWDVKPNFKGGKIEYKKYEKVLEGTGWSFNTSNDYYGAVKIIIDGIEYPLDLNALRGFANASILDSTGSSLLLYFNNGDLSLSANREQIYLDKPTQSKIKARIDTVVKEIKKNTQDEINKLENLYKANSFYRKSLYKIFHNLTFLGQLEWQGIVLNLDYFRLPTNGYSFLRDKSWSKKDNAYVEKIKRYACSNISFEEDKEIYINDLGFADPTAKLLQKAFDDNKNLHGIYLICPSDKITIADLNKSINLDKMAPKLLSSISDPPKIIKKSKFSGQKLIIYKFIGNYWSHVPYSDMENDANDKIIATFSLDYYKTKKVSIKNGKILTAANLSSLRDLSGKSLYAVDEKTPQERIDEEFSQFQTVDDFVDNYFKNNKENFIKIKFAEQYMCEKNDYIFDSKYDILSNIKDKNSYFIKYYNAKIFIRDLNKIDATFMSSYKSEDHAEFTAEMNKWKKDHPEYDITTLSKQFKEKYPFLELIDYYNVDKMVSAVIDYVNLIDKG